MDVQCSECICEFFDCAVNQILYLRHVYPSEDFTSETRFGLSLLHAVNPDLKSYLERLMVQIKQWINQNVLAMLALVIIDVDSSQVLERWTFCIDLKKEQVHDVSAKSTVAQIQTVMKQIISSVSFLPQLPASTTFNVLAYTDKDANVPATWSDSDPRIIRNPQVVKLTPFSTNNKSIQSLVAYRMTE